MQGEAPDWVRDGIRQFLDEVRAFVRTAVDFTARPVRFAREWSAGQRHALNPLGFLATAFAVAGPANALFAAAVRTSDVPGSLLRDALGALTPFVYYVALGSLQHGVLRLFGSRRPLRDSCAMALYAGGGPAMVSHLFVLGSAYFLWRRTGTLVVQNLSTPFAWFVLVGTMVAFTAFITTLSASLAGLHARDGIKSWHIAVANVLAFLVTGLAFALLRPPGAFGLHMVFGPTHGPNGWRFACGLAD